MKKVRNLLILLVMTLLLSGCVKYNVNMDIKDDKSMEFTIVYAIDTSMFGDKAAFSDSDLAALKKDGFEIKSYSDGTMKGFTITKKIENIDDVSSTDDVEYSLSAITKNNGGKMFKVKKGFFKNTYTAKFKFDTSDSNLNGAGTSIDDDDDDDFFDDDEDDDDDAATLEKQDNELLDSEKDEDDDDDDLFDSSDYSDMMGNMDLSFNVNLPSSAISNNATTVKNDKKELTWNLASASDSSTIEFEFAISNFSMFYIFLGAGIFVAIVLIITVIVIIQGGKQAKARMAEKEQA